MLTQVDNETIRGPSPRPFLLIAFMFWMKSFGDLSQSEFPPPFFDTSFFWLTKLFNVFPQKSMAFWSLKDLLEKKFEIHHNFTGTNKRSKDLISEMTRRFTGKSIQGFVLTVAKDLRAKGKSFREFRETSACTREPSYAFLPPETPLVPYSKYNRN